MARGPDGRALFVAFTAPGDVVRVRIVEQRRRYARGEVVELVTPGPGRVAPECPAFGVCGGCTWQHLSSEVQHAAKREIVRDALVRIGGLDPPESIPVASAASYGYRQRARVLRRHGQIGYRRRRSHAPCWVARCPILLPSLDAVVRGAAEEEVELDSGPHTPRSDVLRSDVSEWELLARSDGSVRQCRLSARGRVEGPPVVLRVGVHRLRVSPGVFAQSNALMLEVLVAAVCEAAGAEPGPRDNALELFAGAGFLTLPLARLFRRLQAIESSRGALRDLVHNTRHAAPGVEIIGGRVERLLPQLRGSRPDVVVLDPPRVGLQQDAALGLAAVEARRIVYLSCDVATQARDLRTLVAGGYSLRHVEVLDLMPQTAHIETLVTLERDERGS